MSTQPDILIIGGGIIGLAIALDLRQRGSRVTVLTRDQTEAATRAAAGMLAPQAEAIPAGAFQDLALKSLALYPHWIQTIETIANVPCGYWPCGIIAPHYGPLPSARELAQSSPTRQWLPAATLHQTLPDLDPTLPGAWWLPEEGQVDPRRLADALYQAAIALGIAVETGVTVESLQQSHGRVAAVQTNQGHWSAQHYILATGAWGNALLPIPVHPIKGQLLAVRRPPLAQSTHPPLKQILFGPGTYIVPRQDDRIVIGATVESVGFTPHNTLAGLRSLMTNAIQLYPPLADYPLIEQWWGFRPSTPDQWPILGASHCDNLTLAIGHHRNGILLAPVTAKLIGDYLFNPPSQASLLSPFHWQRFLRHPAADPAPIAATPVSMLIPSPSSTMPTLTPAPSSPQSSDSPSPPLRSDTPLTIANRTFRSRLMTGTGKYRTFEDMRQSIVASGCEIVTVAVRRVQTNAPGHEGLADALDWQKLWMLPNTAGCKTAEEAIRVARLGREMAKLLGQEDNNFVKLEVIPDTKYLLPDPIGTLEAAEQLVKEGFAVLPYINADPLLAKRLEEVGCATVMPLGSPIGSGQGIRNAANIQIIIENAQVPVVVDAGIGTPSEAAQAMEMGADALLINTAIAQAQYPANMGKAMGLAAEAGRLAYLSGRIPIKTHASASSPLTGTLSS
ncbi:MAG: glycine oxidase ThiO [Leptolyngbyaceae bacterium]|nr:glycine oxidase ThiO [Leptolyngbyaceae bacterium]